MKISIIVPIYNVSDYVSMCIESIINQDYQNFELILVDDGSTDNSGKICDDYSKNYKNIVVIHKKNGGLSDARNAGIIAATGDYIMFVDGDDFLSSNDCLSLLNRVLEQNDFDIVQYKMFYFYQKNGKYILTSNVNYNRITGNKLEKLEKLICQGCFSPSACDKLIKADIIKKNNILFDKNLLSEDIMWSLKLFLNIDNLSLINDKVYVYRQQRIGSITSNVREKNISDMYKIIKYWVEFDYNDVKTKKLYYNYLAYQYVILITLLNKKNSFAEIRKNIYELKFLLEYDLNFKVKLANKIINMLGLKLGVLCLKTYNFLKNKGIIKI